MHKQFDQCFLLLLEQPALQGNDVAARGGFDKLQYPAPE